MSPSPQKMYQSIPDTVGLPNLCRFFVLFEFPFPRPVLRALYLFNPEGPRFHRPRCLTRFATVRFQKVHTVDGRNPKQPPGMYKTLWIMGGTTNLNWLAGFLNHQQYYLACISIQWDRASTEILLVQLPKIDGWFRWNFHLKWSPFGGHSFIFGDLLRLLLDSLCRFDQLWNCPV